jgi:type IV pilus assembly protein PilV
MDNRSLKNSRGVGLIEVLITLLILSTALLTLASLQTRSLQYNQGSYFRSQANQLGYDMLDRMRANSTNLAAYQTPVQVATKNPVAVGALATIDVSQWMNDIATNLPQGQGGVDCNVNRVCLITIRWNEINTSGNALEDTSTFIYSARL